MPITVGAIRKQRADKRKTAINLRIKNAYKQALKKARQKPTPTSLTEAFSKLDRAAKSHIIHKNKAARLKSRLAKLIKGQGKPRTTTGKRSVPSKGKGK